MSGQYSDTVGSVAVSPVPIVAPLSSSVISRTKLIVMDQHCVFGMDDQMMSLRLAPPLPVIFLLIHVVASGAEWSVKYSQQEICALKGSTVFMNGSYTHPDGLTVTDTFWIIDPIEGVEKPDLSKESDYSGRVEYFTDEQKKHFSLKLSNVEKKDEHQYCFRIITNQDFQKWLGKPGVHLKVPELRVETPGVVTEGGAAVLKCVTTCSLTDPTFIWYKNGRPLTTKTTINNQLHLQPVSSEDAGSYSCAVNEYPSPEHYLRVKYPPKNISVSYSSCGEIVEDSSVTLTCSSDAYPPVENYTWFKEGGVSPVGSGHSYSPLLSGFYYCEARNEHGAQRSAPVSVLNGDSTGLSVILYVVVGVSLSVNALLLTVVFWRRGKRRNRTPDRADNTNTATSGQDNTYTALQPKIRFSDDVYHTVATLNKPQ
ncbi:junctional adhesion molecule A-like [Hoplias malabaricus]|uniref:junctional adhesion molecule A-like n=1 Tax=Hoplias malabaricus TaxID=27720 RepID=UPI003462E6BA